MAYIAREGLSGSSAGTPIVLSSTTSPGTLIHEADGGGEAIDEVYLWVANPTGDDVMLTVSFGGSSEQSIIIHAGAAPSVLVDGVSLSNGETFRAYSDIGGALSIVGYTNRIISTIGVASGNIVTEPPPGSYPITNIYYDPATQTMAGEYDDQGGQSAVLSSNPPAGKFVVTNLFFNPTLGMFVGEYEDET